MLPPEVLDYVPASFDTVADEVDVPCSPRSAFDIGDPVEVVVPLFVLLLQRLVEAPEHSLCFLHVSRAILLLECQCPHIVPRLEVCPYQSSRLRLLLSLVGPLHLFRGSLPLRASCPFFMMAGVHVLPDLYGVIEIIFFTYIAHKSLTLMSLSRFKRALRLFSFWRLRAILRLE